MGSLLIQLVWDVARNMAGQRECESEPVVVGCVCVRGDGAGHKLHQLTLNCFSWIVLFHVEMYVKEYLVIST